MFPPKSLSERWESGGGVEMNEVEYAGFLLIRDMYAEPSESLFPRPRHPATSRNFFRLAAKKRPNNRHGWDSVFAADKLEYD